MKLNKKYTTLWAIWILAFGVIEYAALKDKDDLVQANATRFQVEALFVKATNGNGVGDQIDWSEVTLTVTYTEK